MPGMLLSRLGAVLRETVALEILPRFRSLAEGDIMAKPSTEDPGDLVTVADRAAEQRLGASLSGLVPGSVVVGEEATAADPGILDRLQTTSPVWVVDPLDGTRNFAAGHGPFGTMVALVEGGELLVAAIYLPLEDQLLTAERGRGAFLNGVRIERSSRAWTAVLRGTFYDKFVPEPERGVLAARAVQHARVPGVACAATEYASVALGLKDYVVYYRLLPWDHAPGALIVRESGGLVRHPDGRDYGVLDRRELTLAASSAEAWSLAYQQLFA